MLVGFRRDLNLKADFTLRDISKCFPAQRVTLAQLLDPMVEAKYILTPVLWKYLYRYAKKHQARGNGFGYGMVIRTIRKASRVRCLRVITKMARKF
ncbi:DNA-cytosine methyltransferase [Escherichia coli]|uniref:DNA-cytosine methyltransferase n=1 Tax=Escherichia coli TaxID=562 RepID=A0A376S8Z5_ECOLX|nr:DNA-cytosine methyltransferase [Escherichia coli]